MSGEDPFGRDKEEDPLAAMGWTTSGSTPSPSPAPPAPAPTASASTARPVQGPSEAVRNPYVPSADAGQKRRLVRVGSCAVTLLVLAVIAAAVIPTILSVKDTIDDVTSNPFPAIPTPTIPAVPGVPTSTIPAAPGPPPVGFERDSLLLRRNLAPALRRLQAVTGGRLFTIRIAPDRINAQAVLPGRRMRLTQITHSGGPQVITTIENSALPLDRTFAWSSVNPAAPERIARAATRQADRPASAFDYAVLLDIVGSRWSAFLKGGTAFIASASGESVQRAGG